MEASGTRNLNRRKETDMKMNGDLLEETITILTALMNSCYDFIKEKDGAENA